MNRAERRRQAKAEGKVYKLSPTDLARDEGYQRGLKEGADEQVARTIRIYTTAMMATLYNECGFGKLRMQRVLDHFEATLRRLYDDRTIEPKLRQYVTEKTGLNPDDFTGCRKLDINAEMNLMKAKATYLKPEKSQEAVAVTRMPGKETESWKQII